MNRVFRAACLLTAVLLLIFNVRALAQKGDFLSDEEEDALREAQDPGKRIEVYLELEQARLLKMDEMRSKPNGVAVLMSEYVTLCQEMKNWIQYQYDRKGDMREGLRALLDHGPEQLDHLKQIQNWSESASAPYRFDLRDAINSMTDALDGSTQALTDQQKVFGELKRQEKEDKKETKARLKEEKKRNKQEEKLRKKMERQSKSDDQ